jgi:hypothetical protein
MIKAMVCCVALSLFALPAFAEDTPGKKFIRQHYAELLKFKGSDSFKEFGFGTGGPHNKWLVSVERAREEKNFPLKERFALSDTFGLGFAYLASKGAENEKTKYFRAEIEKVLNE